MPSTEHTCALIGASIGMAHQHSGLAAVLRHERLLHDHNPQENWDRVAKRWKTTVSYQVQAIDRPALGTPLPVIAERIKAEMTPDCHAVVDVTRVGLSFADLLRRSRAVPIVMVDAQERRRLQVPRHAIFGRLHTAMADGRVDATAGGEVLMRALASFLPDEKSDADDLVTAVAVAIWWSKAMMRSQVHQPAPPREPVQPPQPPSFDQLLARSRRARLRTRI